MNHRIILDLCGGTGAWSRPYVEAGYDVRLVTLPQNDVRDYEPPESVWGILAAPPCTMFSLARRTAKTPPDFDGAISIVGACLRIIWRCRSIDKLRWWCLENPVGLLRQFLGKPFMTFQPCDYGDPWTKKTDLWGYFTPPKKNAVAVDKPKGRVPGGTRDWSCAKTGRNGLTRQQVRALTPPGFARAFFEANP